MLQEFELLAALPNFIHVNLLFYYLMRVGETRDVCMLRLGLSVWMLLEERLDGAELITNVFEFFVEFVAVVSEPVLDAFEQVSWKVAELLLPVGLDILEPLCDEFLVGLWCDGQATLVEPFGGPRECVEEHSAVLVEAFLGLFVIIELSFYLVEKRLGWEFLFHRFGLSGLDWIQ